MRGYIAKLRWAKYVRITLMFSLIVILLVATVPTIFFNWGEAANNRRTNVHITSASANSTAMCFLDVNYGVRLYKQILAGARDQDLSGTGQYESLHDTHQLQITIFSMVLVVFGFTTRLVKLFGPLEMSFNMYIREPLSKLGRTCLRHIAARQPTCATELWEVVVLQPALAVFLMLRLAADLAGSMLAEVYWLFCVVIWGTFNLDSTRRSIMKPIVEDENQWTFGQILPVLLLVGPLLSISTGIAYKYHEPQASNPNEEPEALCLDNPANIHKKTEQNLEEADARSFRDIEATRRQIGDPVPNVHISPAQQRLELWLDHGSSMRSSWMPLYIIIPCYVVLALTSALFAFVFLATDKMQGTASLSEVLITIFGLIFICAVDLPTACTATVLLGLRLNSWMTLDHRKAFLRRSAFFVICVIIYVLLCVPLGVLTQDAGVGLPPFLLRPYVFSFFKLGVLYSSYVVWCIIWFIRTSVSRELQTKHLDV
ncbi:hypothetical protein PG985_003713 [Apiospora marii]|uniref:Uncharacterized protein n=1 Tax=Apiospora marii TaxID=335849 RepID=A0ABR1SHB9_9PEZI